MKKSVVFDGGVVEGGEWWAEINGDILVTNFNEIEEKATDRMGEQWCDKVNILM